MKCHDCPRWQRKFMSGYLTFAGSSQRTGGLQVPDASQSPPANTSTSYSNTRVHQALISNGLTRGKQCWETDRGGETEWERERKRKRKKERKKERADITNKRIVWNNCYLSPVVVCVCMKILHFSVVLIAYRITQNQLLSSTLAVVSSGRQRHTWLLSKLFSPPWQNQCFVIGFR